MHLSVLLLLGVVNDGKLFSSKDYKYVISLVSHTMNMNLISEPIIHVVGSFIHVKGITHLFVIINY